MSTKAASISFLLDKSGSMASKASAESADSKLQLLKTDTNTFMTIMQVEGPKQDPAQNGQVGLVKFNDSAEKLFERSTLDSDGKILEKAIKAVDSLSATGGTNIADAIKTGHTMLNGASDFYNKAMILFSDGDWNTGGDPRRNLPTDIPIYTIGYGSNTSKLEYLKTIATKTKGRYHPTGDPLMLMTIYNEIIQETRVAQTVANAGSKVGEYGLFRTSANIPAGEPWHLFVSKWDDNSLTYTGTTPGRGQIQVVLNSPAGDVVTPDVVEAPEGEGYAVLKVNNPVAGTWQITTHPAKFKTKSLAVAHGVFTELGAIDTALTPHSVNSPLRVTAQVTENGVPLDNVDIHAYSVHPRYSYEELMDRHKEDVKRIIDSQDFPEDVDPEEAALQVLSQEQPELGLFHHECKPGARVSRDGDGHLVEIQSYKQGVPNAVYVEMSGTSPSTGRTFQQTRLVTVVS